MSSYSSHFQNISNNIRLLYKNFFHWNISKVCIFLYANIMGFIVSIPFIGILVYQYLTTYSTLGISVSAEEFLLEHISAIIISILVLLCIVTIFICTYTYGNFLLQNVYKSYLDGTKLPYTKNLYFSFKHFKTYIGILGWISLYLLMPIIVVILLAIGFGITIRMGILPTNLVVGIITIALFIGLVGWFIYLALRLIFSYYNLLYSEKINTAKSYVNESLRLTKKRV